MFPKRIYFYPKFSFATFQLKKNHTHFSIVLRLVTQQLSSGYYKVWVTLDAIFFFSREDPPVIYILTVNSSIEIHLNTVIHKTQILNNKFLINIQSNVSKV